MPSHGSYSCIWKLEEMSRNNDIKNQCENDVPCTSWPRKWGIPGRRTVEHEPIVIITKPRHHADTPGYKRRGVLPGGVLPYKGLMGTCGQPGYVFRDFCPKQGIDFIIFCLNQGIDFINFCLKQL